MKKENNLDEFDNILFEYYKNNRNVPLSTQKAIQTAFTKEGKNDSVTPITILKRVAILIFSISVVTASTVFAKDIINFINNIFNNSNAGIDLAVENGYVQNVDMDFIECNNIGIKVDYILMEEHSLDISFVYKNLDESNHIDTIKFSNLSITDDQNNLLFTSAKENTNNNNQNIIETISMFNIEQQIIDSFTIRDSLLLTSNQTFPTSKTLNIDISSITVKNNNEIELIDGSWSFSINLDTKFVTRNSFNFIYSTTSPYVDNVLTSLTEASLSIELELNTLIDNNLFLNPTNISLQDENNLRYNHTSIVSKNFSTTSTIKLLYPITIYDNINNLFLHINIDLDKSIDITLSR